MRHFLLSLSVLAAVSLMSGCASECEKKCDKVFSDAKAAAGVNWATMEDTANAALKLCKAQCE